MEQILWITYIIGVIVTLAIGIGELSYLSGLGQDFRGIAEDVVSLLFIAIGAACVLILLPFPLLIKLSQRIRRG